MEMYKYTEVNKVLMDWNPLSVDGPALSDEYIGLIPSILAQESELDLEKFLKQVMSNQYGVEYEDSDIAAKEEFHTVINRVASILLIK
jgi:hypothetical protein